MRLGAGRDEIVRRLDALAVNVQGGPIDEASAAIDELDVVLVREVEVLLLAYPFDDLALACDQHREVDRPTSLLMPGNRVSVAQ